MLSLATVLTSFLLIRLPIQFLQSGGFSVSGMLGGSFAMRQFAEAIKSGNHEKSAVWQVYTFECSTLIVCMHECAFFSYSKHEHDLSYYIATFLQEQLAAQMKLIADQPEGFIAAGKAIRVQSKIKLD